MEIFKKGLHSSDAGRGRGLGRTLGLCLCSATAQHGEGGKNLALDALIDDGEEEGPDIGGGSEIIAAIADTAVDLHDFKVVSLLLRNPDFTTARQIADAVNDEFHKPIASALDSTRVDIAVAAAGEASVPVLISRVQNLILSVHTPAKIIVNERTGTIVLGGDVKLTPVSVIHGNLSIEVSTQYAVAPIPGATGALYTPPGAGGQGQGQPFDQRPTLAPGQGTAPGQGGGPRPGGNGGAGNNGPGNSGAPGNGGQNGGAPGNPGGTNAIVGQPGALVPETTVTASDSAAQTMRLDDGANVEELVNGLHALGTTARDVVAILQAIKAEGGLQAELEVQ